MVVSEQRRAVGVFSERQQAEQALNELKASNFSMDKVSLIAKETEEGDQVSGTQVSERIGNQNVESGTAVVADAATSSAWGSVLVGLGSLAIPGLGPLIAAGSVGVALVTTLAGIGLGTLATGNLVKALTDLGISQESASAYADSLEQGNYLVIVDGTQEEIGRAEAVFSNGGIQNWGIYNSPQV
ncbi:general stress protein [Microcoleus sp. FACHB-672]|uniref:general stress protein n=1 Tax=Microcoleus sp. FACHB-672 TaxID=2692825 RepID=UPI0016849616|nr:general stress protein [Microcoleus sp. FACHB-672]MBD2040951.1 general stress protein [Microcoleus sp. FACHB-672]